MDPKDVSRKFWGIEGTNYEIESQKDLLSKNSELLKWINRSLLLKI